MQQYLKHYQVKIHAVSPIYIGSGSKIGKKEYIYMPWNHQVIIPDIGKMYQDLSRKGLARAYTEFMMDSRNGQIPLSQWLAKQGFRREDYESWKLYKMDAGEAFCAQTARPKEIEAFVKDAYGLPYVPGSSIKGMLRTMLLTWEICKNPERFQTIRRDIQMGVRERRSRKDCLARETDALEQMVLYTLSRDEKKLQNAVNDCLSGLHIGDSQPIPLEQLTLSQKVDYTLDEKRKPLPLLRETLIPGTEICFDMSIDTSLCAAYDMKDIMEAAKVFQNMCNQYFYSRFHRSVTVENAVFLGGGCGFLSKTVLYALFGQDAVPVIDKVFQATLGKNYSEHKHMRDQGLKIAPHVCKCTVYQGELYDMGIGTMEYV